MNSCSATLMNVDELKTLLSSNCFLQVTTELDLFIYSTFLTWLTLYLVFKKTDCNLVPYAIYLKDAQSFVFETRVLLGCSRISIQRMLCLSLSYSWNYRYMPRYLSCFYWVLQEIFTLPRVFIKKRGKHTFKRGTRLAVHKSVRIDQRMMEPGKEPTSHGTSNYTTGKTQPLQHKRTVRIWKVPLLEHSCWTGPCRETPFLV